MGSTENVQRGILQKNLYKQTSTRKKLLREGNKTLDNTYRDGYSSHNELLEVKLILDMNEAGVCYMINRKLSIWTLDE